MLVDQVRSTEERGPVDAPMECESRVSRVHHVVEPAGSIHRHTRPAWPTVIDGRRRATGDDQAGELDLGITEQRADCRIGLSREPSRGVCRLLHATQIELAFARKQIKQEMEDKLARPNKDVTGLGIANHIREETKMSERETDKAMQEIPVPERLKWVPEEVRNGGESYDVGQMWVKFAEAIRTNKRIEPDFDSAVRRHRMLDAIRKASETGQKQKVVL